MFQAVPQDETMKERQADVYFRRNPEMLEFLKESLLSACLEGAGWLPLRCAASFSSSFFSFRTVMTFLLTVIEGGGLPPSERLSSRRKVSRFL